MSNSLYVYTNKYFKSIRIEQYWLLNGLNIALVPVETIYNTYFWLIEKYYINNDDDDGAMQRHNNNLTMQYACGTNQRVRA